MSCPLLPHGGLCPGEPGRHQVADFEKRHVVEVTKKGEKRIKEGYKTCQFLDDNHMCSVYEARPHDCRGYVCWNQPNETVYGYAVFLQTGVGRLRAQEK
jgi:Fe-S-cluster containining protein